MTTIWTVFDLLRDAPDGVTRGCLVQHGVDADDLDQLEAEGFVRVVRETMCKPAMIRERFFLDTGV